MIGRHQFTIPLLRYNLCALVPSTLAQNAAAIRTKRRHKPYTQTIAHRLFDFRCRGVIFFFRVGFFSGTITISRATHTHKTQGVKKVNIAANTHTLNNMMGEHNKVFICRKQHVRKGRDMDSFVYRRSIVTV